MTIVNVDHLGINGLNKDNKYVDLNTNTFSKSNHYLEFPPAGDDYVKIDSLAPKLYNKSKLSVFMWIKMEPGVHPSGTGIFYAVNGQGGGNIDRLYFATSSNSGTPSVWIRHPATSTINKITS